MVIEAADVKSAHNVKLKSAISLANEIRMNASLIILEISVIGLGLVLMLADLWMPAEAPPVHRLRGHRGAGHVAGSQLERQRQLRSVRHGVQRHVRQRCAGAVLQTLFHRRGDSGAVHGGGIFRPHRGGQHFRILFAHRVCAGGNVVRRVGQRLRDAVRFHRTHHHHVLRARRVFSAAGSSRSKRA